MSYRVGFMIGYLSGVKKKLKGCPVSIRGSKKYVGGRSGMFSVNSFPGLTFLPAKIKSAMVDCANSALSADTWKRYGAISNHLERCQVEFKMRFTFPMTSDQITTLVMYLREIRKVKKDTIENYLSSLRYIHLSKGVFPGVLRPEVVKTLLKGMSNQDLKAKRSSPDRFPVTLEVMFLLEWELEDRSDWSKEYKLLVWAVSTLAFFGSFRVGELLSKKARSIDPDFDLLLRDVRIVRRMVDKTKVELLEVQLKSPKEATANDKNIKVEVFGNDTPLCPLRAFKKYINVVGVNRSDSAAFRLPVFGLAYRHSRFNSDLKSLLSKHVKYGKFTGHSFRSGLSSLLGQAGFSDPEIMAIGRWSGDSFLRYVKSGRLIRSRNSEKVGCFVKNSIRALEMS